MTMYLSVTVNTLPVWWIVKIILCTCICRLCQSPKIPVLLAFLDIYTKLVAKLKQVRIYYVVNWISYHVVFRLISFTVMYISWLIICCGFSFQEAMVCSAQRITELPRNGKGEYVSVTFVIPAANHRCTCQMRFQMLNTRVEGLKFHWFQLTSRELCSNSWMLLN